MPTGDFPCYLDDTGNLRRDDRLYDPLSCEADGNDYQGFRPLPFTRDIYNEYRDIPEDVPNLATTMTTDPVVATEDFFTVPNENGRSYSLTAMSAELKRLRERLFSICQVPAAFLKTEPERPSFTFTAGLNMFERMYGGRLSPYTYHPYVPMYVTPTYLDCYQPIPKAEEVLARKTKQLQHDYQLYGTHQTVQFRTGMLLKQLVEALPSEFTNQMELMVLDRSVTFRATGEKSADRRRRNRTCWVVIEVETQYLILSEDGRGGAKKVLEPNDTHAPAISAMRGLL